MSPTAARSNRSSLHHPRSSPIPTPLTTSPVYHQQQQQQQILYAPVSNPMVTLQPCSTTFQPSYIYPNVPSHVNSSNSVPLHLQGLRKISRNRITNIHFNIISISDSDRNP